MRVRRVYVLRVSGVKSTLVAAAGVAPDAGISGESDDETLQEATSHH